MRRVLWFGALLVILNLLSAATAMADETVDYTLTAQGSSTALATWQMSLNPTPTCPAPGPCSVSGDYFAENVEISIDGGPATPDTLVFFSMPR